VKTSKIIAAIALAAGSLLTVAHANPTPAITNFDFTTEGGFIDNSATCNTSYNPSNPACELAYSGASDPGLYPGVTHNQVSWGIPFTAQGQSALFTQHYSSTSGTTNSLSNTLTHIAPQIITNGGWVTIDSFNHANNVITAAGNAMANVGLYGQFDLTPPGIVVPGLTSVAFTETPNLAHASDCPGPNPAGTACDDFFDTTPLNGTAFLFSDGTFNYYLSFQFLDGPGAFLEPSPISGDVRIYTAEGQISTIFTQARIDAVMIPEPGALALFGVALAALGFVRGRKQK
jgi:hypothetical protein